VNRIGIFTIRQRGALGYDGSAAAEAERQRQEQRADLEATLRKRFIAAGGSPDEWEVEKAELVAEHRRRVVVDDSAEQAARRAQGSLYSQF
jgi:D-serine deaminase-like pyridoxal phosphate-dependent protein